jgi:hypothetical protein
VPSQVLPLPVGRSRDSAPRELWPCKHDAYWAAHTIVVG